MINYSAIQILRTFSDKEHLLFAEFLNTPFHNKNKKVIKLFNLLKPMHPDYSGKFLTDEKLFRKLAGKVKFRGSYIRNLFSDLNILLEKFLQYNLITKNFTYERLLIEELKNRDLYKLAEIKIKSFERDINKLTVRDHEYYQNKNFVFELKSFLVVDKTLTDSFRSEQISGIIKLFMISLMESSLYLKVEEQRVKIKHEYGFLKHSLMYLKDNIKEFEDSPLLLIYYYLWQSFMNEGDEKYFLKARKYFRKHFSVLTKIDKKNIYSGMQVHYIEKIDAGNSSYTREFLNFLMEMVKFNVLSHRKKDFISLNLYRNILILCVMEKETKVLNKFISEFINYVSEDSRESILAYSNAHLNFLKKKFEKTLELCSKINFNDLLTSTNDNLFFKNDIKSLTMRCLYELGHYESALSAVDAFKHYLRHSKLMNDNPKNKYMNYLRFITELIRLNTNMNEFNLRKLKKQIENTDKIVHKNWLSEKVTELENSM